MKLGLFIPLAATLFVANGWAQDRIYRCGNEYTNTLPDAKAKGCKLVEGANVTVIQAPRPTASKSAASANGGSQKVDTKDQRARDTDARQILEAELKRTQDRLAELTREYNNGEPERRPEEAKAPHKYAERVAELKANIARTEADIAGIRREIERTPSSAAGSR